MNAPMPHPRSRQRGFSLVELLVALVFISFLMAGMLRIYGAAIQGFAAANETVKAQRDNRWALVNLEDDLQAAGYYFPIRIMPSGVNNTSTSAQNPLMILPSQTITNKYIADPTNPSATPTTETLTFDEMQFMTDQVLPVAAQLSAQPTSDSSISVTVNSGDLSSIQAGDFAILMDPAFEIVQIGGGPYSGTSGTITLNATSIQDPSTGAFMGAFGSLRSLTHQAGVDVMFIRPNQVIRYTLLPLALDPANTSATVPCLVRDQTAYPSNGARISWPASTATAAQLTAAGVTRTVVAENVTALRFDLSANQGTSWTRAGDWSGTVANINTQLSAMAAASPGAGYVTSAQDATNPLWYRSAPVLLRADVTTRTLLRRADYAATKNTSAFRTRTQTIFVQPRNFGLGI